MDYFTSKDVKLPAKHKDLKNITTFYQREGACWVPIEAILHRVLMVPVDAVKAGLWARVELVRG